ncbi:hypothetical protein KC349_g129 [Hortaea werneckii]|nr:hypothetical protein KC349_g129 [Hortaea werneckii]
MVTEGPGRRRTPPRLATPVSYVFVGVFVAMCGRFARVLQPPTWAPIRATSIVIIYESALRQYRLFVMNVCKRSSLSKRNLKAIE